MAVRKATAKTSFIAVIHDISDNNVTTKPYPTEEELRKALVTDYLGDDRSDNRAREVYLDDEDIHSAKITIYEIVGKPKEVRAEVAGIKLVDVTGL